MLILSRKLNERLVIDGRIVVHVIKLDNDHVKIGIEAPRDVPVFRTEVYEEIKKNNNQALTSKINKLPKLQPTATKPEATHSR